MNKLLLILSLSFMLAGEMEVDGDLNVSGDIQSPTIALYDNGTTNYAYGGFNNIIYDGNNLVRFKIVTCDSGYLDADVKLSVTAQFSDSDVQLRKTGFQSKDKRTIK